MEKLQDEAEWGHSWGLLTVACASHTKCWAIPRAHCQGPLHVWGAGKLPPTCPPAQSQALGLPSQSFRSRQHPVAPGCGRPPAGLAWSSMLSVSGWLCGWPGGAERNQSG